MDIKFTNTTTGDFILPNGVEVPALGSVEASSDRFSAADANHPVVQAWIASGALLISEPDPGEARASSGAAGATIEEMADKVTLQAKAADLGISVDKRWSVDTLKAKIAEAVAAAPVVAVVEEPQTEPTAPPASPEESAAAAAGTSADAPADPAAPAPPES